MENKSMSVDEFAYDMGLTVLMAREAIKKVSLNILLGLLEWKKEKQELRSTSTESGMNYGKKDMTWN